MAEAHDSQRSIVAEGLTKRYGSVTAVDDLSFSVRSAAVTGFLGPNGAGKTTTLRMVLGLARPTAGAPHGPPVHGAARPGQIGRGQPRDLRDAPGPLGAQPPAGAGGDRRAAGARVDEVLDLVEMREAANRRAGGYSRDAPAARAGGRAARRSRVLVLDEPANGLDPQGIRWLRDFLRGVAAEGRTVLVSSHVLSEVSRPSTT